MYDNDIFDLILLLDRDQHINDYKIIMIILITPLL